MSRAALVRRSYRGAPAQARVHTWFRSLSCPFAAVERAVPGVGRVLEVGCGHGFGSLYLGIDAPQRQVLGVDIDAAKVAVACAAATRARLGNVSFEHVRDGYVPEQEWDAIVVIDVLYLLGTTEAMRLLVACSRALVPGGRLLVKEIDLRPRWKYQFARLQEIAATKLLRITAGSTVEFLAPSAIESAMRDTGLETQRRRVDRFSPWPHLLISGTRAS